MEVSLSIIELSVVFVVEGLDSSFLNPDLLIRKGIVPEEWERTQPTISSSGLSQIVYSNSVSIQAVGDRIVFEENMVAKNEAQNSISTITKKFIDIAPIPQLRAVGINPKYLLRTPTREAAEGYNLQKFVKDGAWSELDERLPIVNIKFTYPRSDGWFQVSIDQVNITTNQQSSVALSFAANNHFELQSQDSQTQREEVTSILSRFDAILGATREILLSKHVSQ